MKVVNTTVPKKEGIGLITGRSGYTDDLADKNALIIRVLRSPHAFAKIKSIDVSEAEAMDGVHCVLTYKDVPRKRFTRAGQGYPEPSPKDRYIMEEYLRHPGDEVCAVAADNEKIAELALEKVKVEYEVLEPVLDMEEAEEHASKVHPEDDAFTMFDMGFDPKKNIACTYDMEVGDVEKTLASCDVVVDETYYTHAQAHAMMEPHTCTAYVDMHQRLNVITSTQTPTHMRRILGEALEMPVSKIRVFKPRVGGGYGGKQQLHGEMICSLVALRTGRSARLTYKRSEVFSATCSRHPMRFKMRIGSDKAGNIRAIDMQALADTGAYGEHALTVYMVAGSKTLPLYNHVESVRFGGKVMYTNHPPAGAYRGYGAIQGNFALESAMCELAVKLGMEPSELRAKNMIKEGETSPIFQIMGEGGEGTAMTVESCKLDYCLKRVKEISGWDKKFPRVQMDGDKVRSVGLAIAMQGSGIPHMDMGSAVLKLNDDGFFNMTVGATDLGTGSDTIMAQIAAEAMGCSADRIVVYASDTDLTPFDCGAYASSTTYISGSAARNAGEQMKELIEKEGARKLELKPEEVEFDGDVVKAKDGSAEITLEDLSSGLYYTDGEGQKQLIANGSYVGHKSPPPYMAAVAEIELDTKTGDIKVLEYSAVTDCGTTINPGLCQIQVEGALVQGIGMTMYEKVEYTDSGNLLTNTFQKYRLPTRVDAPKLNCEFAESYEPSGPYGAKSVGEIGIDTPPAAIANAIYNAVGVRIRTLPLTPEKILKAIREKG